MNYKNSQKKRNLQNIKARLRNRADKAKIKTYLKSIKANTTSLDKMKENLALLFKAVDKATKKNVIHQNKGNRIKRKAQLFLNNISVK